jgi:phage baseplate assembly protein W
MAKYTDIDLNFTRNPITNDVSVLQDEAAVKSAVRNIILTNLGERPFNSTFGSGLRRLLFEPLTPITATSLEILIENALQNFEPRVEIMQVNVIADLDSNGFDVTVGFRMRGDTRIVLVPITLKRLR